jgi:tRNA-dihydrouridine synthase B
MPYLVLAPIRGLTDAAFRAAYTEHFGGFDEALAPFLAPELPRPLRPKDIAEVSPANNSTLPTTPQILGKDPEVFLATARMLADVGCTQVNWNLGCPQPAVTKGERGAGLLPHPDRIAAFLDRVMPAIGMGVSVKVRLGLHAASELGPVLDVLNRYPLQEVTIHARTADQMYKGRADPDAFERYAPQCRHRLVYNGDITEVASFGRLVARFSFVSRWMVGRGAIMEPTLARVLRGEAVDPADRLVRMRRLHDALLEHYLGVLQGPGHVLDRLIGLWEYWTDSIAGKRKLIKRLRKTTEMDRYRKGVDEILGPAP